MLVNSFKNTNNVREDVVIRNITVMIDSLPDILKRAPQKTL